MLRSFLTLSLLLPAPSFPGMMIVSPSAIVKVLCFSPKNVVSGTAFRVGNGLLLSVNHVTSTGKCFIEGRPIALRYKSPKADFSMIDGRSGAFLRVDCGGFVKGRRYLAIGYARGLDTLTTIELVGTGDKDHGQAVLTGILAVVPGQSGGPIIDEETGSVVGTVNSEDFEDGLSWSVPLSTTPVCRSAA